MGGKRTDRQGGFVENGNVVRIDVYHVTERKHDSNFRKITPGYYLVPVYVHEISTDPERLPRQAMLNGRPYRDWPSMEPSDFLFSLYKDSYVCLSKPRGNETAGYHRGPDRSGAKIDISPHNRRHTNDKIRGNGVKTLTAFRKFHVDRLGNLHEIKREPWPGSNRE